MNKQSVSKEMLNWYYENKRTLPWRGETNFYNVWISEVMLQQTQVKAAIPYYNNWIVQFPNVSSVVKAPEDVILKAWEGLGYYARARNFKKACEIITNNKVHFDKITLKEFKSLPGVGEYISSAVFSIVRDTPVPVIDANVKRVISRILMLEKPPEKSVPEIKKYLDKIISKKFPGDFNQAIMELGAILCKPGNPKCKDCPVNSNCGAYKNSTVHKYPRRIEFREKPHFNIAVGVIWKNNKVLITKRKSSGLLGGLWEFPGGKVEKNESLVECVKREILEELDIEVKVLNYITSVQHAYTHFSITMHAYNCEYIDGTISLNNSTGKKFIQISEFDKYPFPKANHKLFPYINQLDYTV